MDWLVGRSVSLWVAGSVGELFGQWVGWSVSGSVGGLVGWSVRGSVALTGHLSMLSLLILKSKAFQCSSIVFFCFSSLSGI